MRHKRLPRRWRRCLHAARWLEMLWSCYCDYHNVATYRCLGCGRRPPRDLVLRAVDRQLVDA